MKQVLKRVVLYLLAAIVVIVVALSASVFLFQDRIIHRFVTEANKKLNTPVRIGKIDISAWSDFPNLAIVFNDVYVEDSQPGEYPLLTAERVSFFVNPIEVWNGTYSIRALKVEGSETNLKIDSRGVNNYTIFKKATEGDTTTISFHLRNVRLSDTHVTFSDLLSHNHHEFESEALIASIGIRGDLYDIGARGDVTTKQIGIENHVLLRNKRFEVNAKLVYDDAAKDLKIESSTLDVDKSGFELAGNYIFADRHRIDLSAKAKNTDIQSLLSLLPEEIVQKVSRYQSDGQVYFNGTIKGEIGERHSPSVSVSFGCKDTRLTHPDFRSKLTHANLEGSFASPSLVDFSRAELFLRNVTGRLNDQDFSANLSVENFDDPVVALDFKGDLDAASVLHFYPLPDVSQLEGRLKADVSLAGKISLLKKKTTAQQVSTHGSIEMENLQLTVGARKMHFKDLNGSLQFTRNDLALSNVTGQFEHSDFRLNGFFKNAVTWLLFENQPIGIETDLESKFIDLDELMALGFGQRESKDFSFSISPLIHLRFNCDIRTMKYKRFKPRNLKGDLLIKNQMAISRQIHLQAMGGNLALSGVIDAKKPKAIDVVSSFNLKGLHLDSIFYVFENFGQDFIQDKHLKGLAFADVSMDMTLDEKLKLFPGTLITDIGLTVKNGELNEFAPLQKLNRYLDDEGLSHLRFGELKNEIHIENKTVYIPQMEIASNVTVIQLSGTHTFDQAIDYRVVAPLRNKKKIDPDEAFGAVEEDAVGKSKVFLKITGTTDQYEVSYDKAAVRKKIAGDFKKEVNELKDAFKARGKKKQKELELEKDEFFEWDNP